MSGPKKCGDLVYRRGIPDKIGTVVGEADHKGELYVEWHHPRALQSVDESSVDALTPEGKDAYLKEHPEAEQVGAWLRDQGKPRGTSG